MRSRRDFLKTLSVGLGALPFLRSPWLSASDEIVPVPGAQGMIVRSARFLDLEMPMEFLNSWITPVPHFFIRNHMHEPSTLEANSWTLTVAGEVEKPLTLSLADLRKIDSHTVTNTLECAGNGRGLFTPHVPGAQWGKGAVGTARFSGPRMRDILERAGVKPNGKHVKFSGLDEVPGNVPPFIRSIPIEKATNSDTLVALDMNGAPLSSDHGFPARALVPGWIGAASCKWLSKIEVLEKPFEGNFMKPGYRFPNHPLKPGDPLNVDDSHPVTALTVKSLIAAPADGATLRSHHAKLYGAAWAGEADITRVEVSTDGGNSWHGARLGRQQTKYAWRLWSYSWKAPKAGDYTILSRATDSMGRVQPELAEWNPGGYLYNAYDKVTVHVS